MFKIRGIGFVDKSLQAELINEPMSVKRRPRKRLKKFDKAKSRLEWALRQVAWIREYEPNMSPAEIEERCLMFGSGEIVHRLIKEGNPGRYC